MHTKHMKRSIMGSKKIVIYRSEKFWLSCEHMSIRCTRVRPPLTCKPMPNVTFTSCMATWTFGEKKLTKQQQSLLIFFAALVAIAI